jgi:hypothetical protein
MLRQLVSLATRRLLLRVTKESLPQMKKVALISALLLGRRQPHRKLLRRWANRQVVKAASQHGRKPRRPACSALRK